MDFWEAYFIGENMRNDVGNCGTSDHGCFMPVREEDYLSEDEKKQKRVRRRNLKRKYWESLSKKEKERHFKAVIKEKLETTFAMIVLFLPFLFLLGCLLS